jgi:hypothetical protein
MRKLLLTAALMSLAFLGSCAKGGNGPCVENCPAIVIEPDIISEVGLNVSVPLTLTFKNATASPVNWAITPSSCGSACGTLTNVTTSTATYVGPATVPSNPDFTITATSQTDASLTGTLPLEIIPVTTTVGPASVNVGVGLKQEYAAAASPGQAPQTFTWTCTTPNGPCANFTTDQNLPGLAYYTPTAGEECSSGSNCVTVSAVATIDPTGCTINPKIPCTPSATSVVSQRLNGTYAFKFSGYDKNGKATAAAGTFTVAAGGSVSGFEDVLTASGLTQNSFSGGSYSPLNGSNANANNAGTLTLNAGSLPNTFTVVLDSAGDVQMIEADGNGNSGSGIAESSSTNKFNKGSSATFAFGFTGVDSSNNRVGYVGLLPTDGVSAITSGLIDVNDNGSATNSVCNSAPCPVAGSYTYNATTNRGQLTLTSPKAMTFDFFVANGSENNSGTNPLYLYAISTDNNPAVVGTLTYQNPKITAYNNAAFSGTSVSALTGTNDNVALILTTTYGDDSSSGVSGACPASNSGSLSGNFDQNNAGTIVSVSGFPSAAQTTNPYTYIATNGNTGRYIFCLLGNPGAQNGAVLPIPFVLYASGANRGFLLDQSSSAVMTGTMNQQSSPNGGFFANSTAVGTYAVATSSNSVANISGCAQLPACFATMNLVVTTPVVPETSGIPASNVTGVANPGNVPVSLLFNIGSNGYGTISPQVGATTNPPNYVTYGVTNTDFFMIDIDSGVTSPILYMAQ